MAQNPSPNLHGATPRKAPITKEARVHELLTKGAELPHLDFKHEYDFSTEGFALDVAALHNGDGLALPFPALDNELQAAYLVVGVRETDQGLVLTGSGPLPKNEAVLMQELKKRLDPCPSITAYDVRIDGKRVWLIQILIDSRHGPVRFRGDKSRLRVMRRSSGRVDNALVSEDMWSKVCLRFSSALSDLQAPLRAAHIGSGHSTLKILLTDSSTHGTSTAADCWQALSSVAWDMVVALEPDNSAGDLTSLRQGLGKLRAVHDIDIDSLSCSRAPLVPDVPVWEAVLCGTSSLWVTVSRIGEARTRARRRFVDCPPWLPCVNSFSFLSWQICSSTAPAQSLGKAAATKTMQAVSKLACADMRHRNDPVLICITLADKAERLSFHFETLLILLENMSIVDCPNLLVVAVAPTMEDTRLLAVDAKSPLIPHRDLNIAHTFNLLHSVIGANVPPDVSDLGSRGAKIATDELQMMRHAVVAVAADINEACRRLTSDDGETLNEQALNDVKSSYLAGAAPTASMLAVAGLSSGLNFLVTRDIESDLSSELNRCISSCASEIGSNQQHVILRHAVCTGGSTVAMMVAKSCAAHNAAVLVALSGDWRSNVQDTVAYLQRLSAAAGSKAPLVLLHEGGPDAWYTLAAEAGWKQMRIVMLTIHRVAVATLVKAAKVPGSMPGHAVVLSLPATLSARERTDFRSIFDACSQAYGSVFLWTCAVFAERTVSLLRSANAHIKSLTKEKREIVRMAAVAARFGPRAARSIVHSRATWCWTSFATLLTGPSPWTTRSCALSCMSETARLPWSARVTL